METKILEFENAVKNLLTEYNVKYDDISSEYAEAEITELQDDFTGEFYDYEIPETVYCWIIFESLTDIPEFSEEFNKKLVKLMTTFSNKYSCEFVASCTTENL